MFSRIVYPDSRFRLLLLTIFPVIVGIIFSIVLSDTLNSYKQIKDANARQNWLNQATFVASKARGSFSLPLFLKGCTQQLEETLQNYEVGEIQQNPEILRQKMQNFFPQLLLDKAEIWAFLPANKGFKSLRHHFFENNRLRILERAFNNLSELSDAEMSAESPSSRALQKKIETLFGANSAPLQLATLREGIPTPVDFAGHPSYILWKRLRNKRNEPISGFLMVLPTRLMENHRLGLQLLADRSLQLGFRRMAIALVAKGSTKPDIIFPEVLESFKEEKTELSEKIGKFVNQADLKLREIHDFGSYRFYLDHLSIKSPYLMVIFSRTPDQIGTQKLLRSFGLLAAAFIAGLLLLLFKLISSPKKIITTEFSFKILFFTTGLIPILVIGYLMVMQTLESERAQIEQATARAAEKLETMQQKSEIIVNGSSELFKGFISDKKSRALLVSNLRQDREEAFNRLRKIFFKRNLHLNYLFINRPGSPNEFFCSNPEDKIEAATQANYYAISANSLLEHFGADPVILSQEQETLKDGFSQKSDVYDWNIIIDSLERVTSFQTGTNRKQVYMTTMLVEQSTAQAFVTLVVNATKSIRGYFRDQLEKSQQNSDQQFFAVDRISDTSFATIPKISEKELFTETMRSLKIFARAAENSMFSLTVRNKNFVFLYDPFLKVQNYYGIATVDISEYESNKTLKLLFVFIATTLLSSSIYLLSSAISHLMIDPLKDLRDTFNTIAQGNFKTGFCYPYENELGQLAKSTDKMITGLRQRMLLGKFVSNTFDNKVSFITTESATNLLKGTVMFSDIRDFTTLAEANSPERTALALNKHLKEMVEIISDEGGTIEQFIGDAIVAFFPGEDIQICKQALTAAKKMMKKRHEMNLNAAGSGQIHFKIGIGLAFGEVITGTLQTFNRSEFTIIGDARTRSEELETQSKNGRFSRIIITPEIKSVCDQYNFDCHKLSDECYELVTFET